MQTTQKVQPRWIELLALVFFSLLMALKAQAATPVLMLLDSRATSGFGTVLDEKMRRIPGAEVTTYGLCQSSPSAWLEGATSTCGFLRKAPTGEVLNSGSGTAPSLKNLLSQAKPRYTVVVTGEASLNDSSGRIQSDFRATAKAIRASGSKCVWVGPVFDPASRGSVTYYASLRELAEEVECAVADLPTLSQMSLSFDLTDFVVELVKFGELDVARN